MASIRQTAASYDAVADEYVLRIYSELDHKPLDRELLDRFADSIAGKGAVADIGCGPGHVTKYLHERGVCISGYDLSAQMVARARSLTPEIEFFQGDMSALDLADQSCAGLVCFYSLIHIPRGRVLDVLREFHRILPPGGWLLLAFHIGDKVLHLDEWWGKEVCVDFTFFETEEMEAHLQAAGFQVVEVVERDPYAPEVEHQSRRSYVFARTAAEMG